MCANWLIVSLYQIDATVHVLKVQAIYAALASDPKLDLLGTFSVDDVNVDAICIRKTIYIPAPFAGIFLERKLTPLDAWSRLHGAIINTRATVYCRPIIDWLQVKITRKSG